MEGLVSANVATVELPAELVPNRYRSTIPSCWTAVKAVTGFPESPNKAFVGSFEVLEIAMPVA